jgi:hypothetical protein
MTYLPNPTVTINGEDYTGRTIGEVSISRGRDTVYANPAAGYASVELIDVTAGSLGFQAGAPISVTVDDSAGNPVPVFRGIVADWQSNVTATGGEPVVTYRLQAVGPLAILNRRAVLFAGRGQELDGARVLAALTEALPVIWAEFSLTRTWAEMGETTWATVDPGFDPALIDPGVYELVALAAADDGYRALQVVSDAGDSAKGLLFETPDGFVGYADSDRRAANAQTGFLTVPFEVLSVDGLSLASALADVTNRVFVEYGAADVVTDEDLASIVRFGLQETRLRTLLAREEDAEARAEDILFSRSRPPVELQEVTVNLRGLSDDTLRDALLAVNSNDAVRVTGLPEKVGFGLQGFRGFVEGVRLRVSEFQADVSLLVSDENLSFGSVLWAQVDATIAWQDVDGALVWADARRVTT